MTGRTPIAVAVLLLVRCLRRRPTTCFNDRRFPEFALLSEEDLRTRSLIRASCSLIRASISWNSASTASVCSRNEANGLRNAPDRFPRPIDSFSRSINLLNVLTPPFHAHRCTSSPNSHNFAHSQIWALSLRGCSARLKS